MTTSKVYLNDIGTDIILNAGSALTTQTTLTIKYQKPGGTSGEWVASVYNTNYAKYTTISGDLNEAGTWLLRIYTELASWQGHGNVVEMKVYDSWEQ